MIKLARIIFQFTACVEWQMRLSSPIVKDEIIQDIIDLNAHEILDPLPIYILPCTSICPQLVRNGILFYLS